MFKSRFLNTTIFLAVAGIHAGVVAYNWHIKPPELKLDTNSLNYVDIASFPKPVPVQIEKPIEPTPEPIEEKPAEPKAIAVIKDNAPADIIEKPKPIIKPKPKTPIKKVVKVEKAIKPVKQVIKQVSEVTPPNNLVIPKFDLSQTKSLNNPVSNAKPTVNNNAVIPPSHVGGYLHNPRPPYPSLSRENGEEGKVILTVNIDASGNPSNVIVSKSSGFPRLDRSAKQTVTNSYKFKPATKGGSPIPFTYTFAIVFSLKN